MGLLARRFETRNWLTDDDRLFEGTMTASGTRVSRESSLRLSTVWACVRLLTNTIATLPTDIIVSIGGQRFPEFQKPSWLIAPNPADPTITTTEHFAQVTASILLDGNFFTFCPNTIFDPSVLIVLDPSRVEVVPGPLYRIRGQTGQVIAEVDAMHMLHGGWLRLPGALRYLSPMEAARQGIGTGLTAEEYAGRFFGQGASLSFGVEVPGALTPDQRKEMSEALKASYAGTRKSHAIGILTAGAKFVTGLGITNEQAQFLESRKFTVEDIAGRIYGIPPHMVGSQEPGASSYNSVEQRSLEFREYSVLPLVRRIEDPYQRLVEVPVGLNARSATASFRFNLSGIARADLKTRYESYASGIDHGFLKPDEARSYEELPPLSGGVGSVAYMQQQMVPVGTPPAAVPALPAPRSLEAA